LLDDARVAAAVFGRIAGEQPAVVELDALPAPGPVGSVRAGVRAFQTVRVGQVFVEEGVEFGAEGFDAAIEGELHGGASQSSLDVRRCRRAAIPPPWRASRRTGRRSPRCSPWRRTVADRGGRRPTGTRPRRPWP